MRLFFFIYMFVRQVEIRLDHYKFRINQLGNRLKEIEKTYKNWVIHSLTKPQTLIPTLVLTT